MDTLDVRNETCDLRDWFTRSERLQPAENTRIVHVIDAFRPLIKMLGNPPLFDSILGKMEAAWGERFDGALDLAEQWVALAEQAAGDYGSHVGIEPVHIIRSSPRVFAAVMECRAHAMFQNYHWSIDLTPDFARLVQVGRHMGFTDAACMLLTDPMTKYWYVPKGAKLAVSSNLSNGEPIVLSGVNTDAMQAWGAQAFALISQLLSVSNFVTFVVDGVLERMTKRERENTSASGLNAQVLGYCSASYSRRKNIRNVHPRLVGELSKPYYAPRIRTLAELGDKLVMVDMGHAEAEKITICLANASFRTSASL